MSKYRIGQKLQVMVESIDKNGKAKFKVLKEGAFDSYFDREVRAPRYSGYGDDEETSQRSANYSRRRQSYGGGVTLSAKVERAYDGSIESIRLTANSDVAAIAKLVDRLDTCGGLTGEAILDEGMSVEEVVEYLLGYNEEEDCDSVLELTIDGQDYI